MPRPSENTSEHSASRVPELLAPAGGEESLRAAVAAGADAVYLGAGVLNARRGAENFTIESLADACRFAHLYSKKVYLTANVAILPSETSSALDLIDSAWAAGVDAVIVQDLGLMRLLRETLPHVRLHVSTQVNAHSSDTLRVLSTLGVSRVTLARETSLGEIGKLASVAHDLGIEAESFVHGAICMCYSGQCLLSSMIGGRSANRGLCAQPCRLPYALVDEAGKELADVGSHLLSPKDLAGITVLPKMLQTGIDSLKIEGRMKSPEYVALVTGVYRAALDRAVAAAALGAAPYEVRDGEMSVLSEAFSRGFSEAYLTGERGNDMMSYTRPNNRGVRVGRVVEAADGRMTIALETALDSGDVIEVWTRRGRHAQPVGPMRAGGSRKLSSAPAGSRVSIAAEKPVSVDDRVFRVRNAALTDAARRLFEDPAGPGIPLEFSVSVVIGEPLRVTVTDSAGNTGSAEGDVVEAARTRAVSSEDIVQHVGRLGNTPYAAASWDVALSPGAGVGFSQLHAVRREALAALERKLLSAWAARERVRPAAPSARDIERSGGGGASESGSRSSRVAPRVVAVCGSIGAAKACLDSGAAEAQVPAWALEGVSAADLPPGVTPIVPRIMHDAEAKRLLAPARAARRGVAGTLGALKLLADEGIHAEAHWSLNAMNAYTVVQLAELGASLVWLSPELTLGQIREIAAETDVPVGVAVGGRQELMVTEHCVLMAEGRCAGRCEGCKRRERRTALRDRKGYEFPVVTDPLGRSHIYNAVPLDAVKALPELIEARVDTIRVDMEAERAPSAAAEVRRVRSAIELVVAGKPLPQPHPNAVATTGHFYRGVS